MLFSFCSGGLLCLKPRIFGFHIHEGHIPADHTLCSFSESFAVRRHPHFFTEGNFDTNRKETVRPSSW